VKGQEPVIEEPVFDTAQALAAGWTPGRLRGPSVRRLLNGVFTTSAYADTLEIRARAALVAAGPGARLCEATALCLAGVELPPGLAGPDEPVHIHTAVERCGPQREGVRVHRTAVQLPVCEVSGMPALHLAECWLQVASRATVLELTVLGDGLMRRPRPPEYAPYLVGPDVLADAIAGSHRRPGIRRSRRSGHLLRPNTDSPMESVTRFYLVQAGLPEPCVNYPILDDEGFPVFYLDLAYPEQLVAVEYDGAVHAGDVARMKRDISRRRRLEDAGWRIITASADDLSNKMADVVRSVRRELAARTLLPAPPRVRMGGRNQVGPRRPGGVQPEGLANPAPTR